MLRIASMLFSAVLLLSAVGSAAADIKDDVTSAYKAWDAAFNKADAKALAAFYAADAKLLPPTHTIVAGPAEIEKFFAGLLTNGVKGHALKIIEIGGSEKMAYGTANWSASDKDGKAIGGYRNPHLRASRRRLFEAGGPHLQLKPIRGPRVVAQWN